MFARTCERNVAGLSRKSQSGRLVATLANRMQAVLRHQWQNGAGTGMDATPPGVSAISEPANAGRPRNRQAVGRATAREPDQPPDGTGPAIAGRRTDTDPPQGCETDTASRTCRGSPKPPWPQGSGPMRRASRPEIGGCPSGRKPDQRSQWRCDEWSCRSPQGGGKYPMAIKAQIGRASCRERV